MATLLAATLVVACTNSDDDDATDEDTDTTDVDDTTSADNADGTNGTDDTDTDADNTTGGGGEPGGEDAVNLCDYLPAEDLDALNPRDDEPVSTILLGDFTYLGCTIGDVYSISFGIRVIDDGDPYENLVVGEPEDLDGFGDEAKVTYHEAGPQRLASQTVAYFGEIVVIVRNDSIGNANPDVQVEDERVYEAMTAFAEALPDDIVERSLAAVVDSDVCPGVDSDLVTALAGDVVLARGGHADDAERCAYRGEDGTQIRLSSRAQDEPIDYELSGEPISLPNVEGADGTINDNGGSVELTVISPAERLSFITVISADRDEPVDADRVIEIAEGFLTLVG